MSVVIRTSSTIDEIRSATLSECGTYRYELSRVWSLDGPRVLFVMLNPSTADHDVDDPTIRKCSGFAKRWGFSGLVVVNLFAFRATKPADLKKAEHPVGELNRDYLLNGALECDEIVCAWGAHGKLHGRGLYVRTLLKAHGERRGGLKCLGMTKGGQPRHPLYLKNDTERRLMED